MKKISIAMAVYNGERFLEEQLDSILQQLEPQDELVISYDNSKDRTWEIITSFSERYPQIEIYKNITPGVTGNFNNALSLCTGDYLFICDQDDRWAENKRAAVLETFEKTGADMVIHNGVHIDSEGKVISEPFFTTYRIGDGKIRNILRSRSSGCCMAFTREMAQKILPMPPKIDAYDRWIGTVGEFLGKIAYDDRILLYHRMHGDNVTTNTRSIGVILSTRIDLIKELRKRIRRERRE